LENQDTGDISNVYSTARTEGRCCGPYTCTGDDINRLRLETTWIEGRVLTVLAEWTAMDLGESAYGEHLPPLLWMEVREYTVAVVCGDMQRQECRLQSIRKLLNRVRVYIQ
jgi:hypothetical protein